jgi:hypothetical protein
LSYGRIGEVNRTVSSHDKFTVLFNDIRPFERMQFLRGTAELYMDIAEENPDFERTIAMIHEYFMAILETVVKTDADAIAFMDDWGSQRALLINSEAWRKYFKPLYLDYCALAKKRGKKVYMQSDGNIECIIGDLVEIGVDALNSQPFAMDIEEISRKSRPEEAPTTFAPPAPAWERACTPTAASTSSWSSAPTCRWRTSRPCSGVGCEPRLDTTIPAQNHSPYTSLRTPIFTARITNSESLILARIRTFPAR